MRPLRLTNAERQTLQNWADGRHPTIGPFFEMAITPRAKTWLTSKEPSPLVATIDRLHFYKEQHEIVRYGHIYSMWLVWHEDELVAQSRLHGKLS